MLPAKSPLRHKDFMPDIFTPTSLKNQFAKQIDHYFGQRLLRMLTRLGIRSTDKIQAYVDAGGPEIEVTCITQYYYIIAWICVLKTMIV
jgi:hypothetical protein